MGLGWTALAQTGASPWWETLAKAGTFASPLFGFYLTRFVAVLLCYSHFPHPVSLCSYGDISDVAEEEPGGSMDIGYVSLQLTTGRPGTDQLSTHL